MTDPLLLITAIGTAIAIAQPWAIALWKRYVHRAMVEVYPTEFIELGFSEFGPTIGIEGTLRALQKDVFVRSVRLCLTKLSDHSRHAFDWIAFRPHRKPFTPSGPESGFFEIAAGFMVTQNAPHRFNIVFSDSSTRERVQGQLTLATAQLWELRRDGDFSRLDQRALLDESTLADLSLRLAKAYQDTPVHVSAFGELDRICYWESGRYQIEFEVNATRPDRTFHESRSFELTAEQAEQLRLNRLYMLDSPLYAMLGLNPPQYYFAYPRHTESVSASP